MSYLIILFILTFTVLSPVHADTATEPEFASDEELTFTALDSLAYRGTEESGDCEVKIVGIYENSDEKLFLISAEGLSDDLRYFIPTNYFYTVDENHLKKNIKNKIGTFPLMEESDEYKYLIWWNKKLQLDNNEELKDDRLEDININKEPGNICGILFEKRKYILNKVKNNAYARKKIISDVNEGLSDKEIFFKNRKLTLYEYNGAFGNIENSRWINQKAALFSKYVEKQNVNLVVLPFFLFENPETVDQTERSLITRTIVENIKKHSDINIINPDIIEYSIGENYRILDKQQIEEIAKRYNADRVLYGYISRTQKKTHLHQKKNYESIFIETLEKEKNLEPAIYHVGKNLFIKELMSDVDNPAFISIGEYMPDILKLIDIDKKNLERDVSFKSSIEPIDIPNSFESLLDGIKNNKELIPFYLQFLATLYPADPDRYRERLYERSFIAADNLPDDNKYVQLLKARALLYLHRRPEAVALLKNDSSPEVLAFIEYLKGNLTTMETLVNKIESPLLKYLAAFEYQQLSQNYVSKNIDKNIFPESIFNKSWRYFVDRKLNKTDQWYRPSTAELIKTIEEQLPGISNKYYEQLALKLIKGESSYLDDFDLYMIIKKQLTEALDNLDNKKIDIYEELEPTLLDKILLLQSTFEESILDDVNFEISPRGSYSSALNKIEKYKNILTDHPQLTAIESYVLYMLSTRENGQQQNDHIIDSVKSAIKSLVWLREFNNYYSTAHNALVGAIAYQDLIKDYYSINRYDGSWENILSLYGGDFPEKYFMPDPRYTMPGAIPIEYLHTELYYLYTNIRNDESKGKEHLEKYLPLLEDRFLGNPERLVMIGYLNEKLGNKDAQVASYENEIKSGSDNYNQYEWLGNYYISEGRYQDAYDLYMQYPYFTKEQYKNENVAISNMSERFGSALFWRGQYDYAKKLYEISIDAGSGSEGNMNAIIRTALIDGDYFKAAEYSLERAKRYNSPYAYRDYMSLLYILGANKEADILFDDIVDKLNSPDPWMSVVVGDRIQKKTNSEIKEWINDKKTNKNTFYLETYAHLTMIVDRPMNDDLLEIINTLLSNNKDELDTERRYAKGYFAARNKQYEAAYDFYSNEKTIKEYKVMSCWHSHNYPLYILSALKTGHNQAVEDIDITDKQIDSCKYLKTDKALVGAVKAAYTKDYDASIKYLKQAFNVRDFTGARKLFTWYQIVEITEILYEESGKKEYLDLILEWAREHQVIQPMYSWAYAVEAKYSEDPERKLQALAYTLYLDPQSERISDIPEELKEKARKWLEENNKFLKKKEVEPESRIAA